MRRAIPFLLTAGCASGAVPCEEEPPSILVEVTAPFAAEQLEIELATEELARRETKPFADEVRMAIAPRPEPGTDLAVTVRALGEGGGMVVGRGSASTVVSPDGCNGVEVMLMPTDGPQPDAGVGVDGGPLPDAGPKDGGPPDTGLPDTGPPDTGVEEICAETPDDDTVFLHTFDLDQDQGFLDSTNQHPGRLQDGPARVDSAEGCGFAMGFTGVGYGQVGSSPEFDLDVGRLDFWVRLDGVAPEAQGIVSRDATGTVMSGHLSVSRNCDDRIVVRIQMSGDVSAYRCSEPLTPGVWTHVEVQFGPPNLALLIDGETTTTASTAVCGPTFIDCQTPFEGGIAGNENPWVYGASSVASQEGVAEPVIGPFTGALDSVRLRR